MFLWFHFASESFHGCHYKLCFLLEQRYWKIFHYIYLWIIVQSVWCQSPFQSPSSASPSRLALFFSRSLSWHPHFSFAVLNPAYLNNSLTSLAVHMEENIPFYSCLNGGINQSDKSKGRGFTACAFSGKRNLKANNCACILSSSLEALFSVWAGCGLVSQTVWARTGRGKPSQSFGWTLTLQEGSFTWNLLAWWVLQSLFSIFYPSNSVAEQQVKHF